ncbi:hypothetical protein MMEU_3738 [Mycobacterium marinum str. Europe]|nr:hypothetical protein MMEU_3738 [Mycobacterium marinum str. Europe]
MGLRGCAFRVETWSTAGAERRDGREGGVLGDRLADHWGP